MKNQKNTNDLYDCWERSPFPSTKISTYFSTYAELFSIYRNKKCVFIETGVLGGGSLFMWRNWLGPKARIIGIDLNPEAKKWIDHGFEIYIGDQGDPIFWQETLAQIGKFDILLDDGGHQSFQQIVTAYEAIKYAKNRCIIAIEDTHTSFMSDFKSHGENTFLNYAKDTTDFLTIRGSSMYPTRMRKTQNLETESAFANINSIHFYNSLVAFKIDPEIPKLPSAIWNKKESTPSDFRYLGKNSASVTWPDLFNSRKIVVNGKL